MKSIIIIMILMSSQRIIDIYYNYNNKQKRGNEQIK